MPDHFGRAVHDPDVSDKVDFMRRKSILSGFMAALAGIGLISGCGSSGQKTLTGSQLTAKIIPAPDGFAVDTTPGESGQLTTQLFSQFGGGEAASTGGFVAGFKQNYVNTGTEEGLSVTLLEFSSSAKASAYYKSTEYKTLSFAAPTYGPLPKLAGAVEATGTKQYNGNYVRGMADSTGRFYFQMVYADPNSSAVPVEFPIWAAAQWELLQPGVSLPTTTTGS
jgi:hypothetical protein